jgi:acyl carrier protein
MTDNEKVLIEIFAEISNTAVPVNLETKIDHLDLDSMDVLDVLMNIKNKLDVDIPIDRFASCEDIESVAKIIYL